MIYDGKKASLVLQEKLKARVDALTEKPSLLVISVASHPAINSFIAIKRKFGQALGITIDERQFEESFGEDALIHELQTITQEKPYTGVIIQLPLPQAYNTRKVLDAIPPHLDVDVLGTQAWNTFSSTNSPVPPVAGAVAHILQDTSTDITNARVVVIGNGMLVGAPVSTWLKNNHANVTVVDITTPDEERMRLYKEADIVISGIGSPHHLTKDFFKQGVVLIDAGTSEQAGVLAGDCDPTCADIASIMTPVPGGVGPLTVAHLFENLVSKAEEQESKKR
jgi:5,10-methylene-tetrahydrofolate dehydrogenase/methenyl tetrahydrofolate cyclohydrolase